jgi:HAD superfamily hydrolase (TIGR01549 family)
MAQSGQISTVFFDYGDTLVENRPSYLQRVADVLAEFGHKREYSNVVHAYTKADYLIYGDIVSGALGSAERYLMHFLAHFGKCLDIDLDWPKALPEITRRFEDDVYERILSEGTLETLTSLKEKGVRLGIISNNDGTCRQKCEEIGIADFFEIIIDSANEGVGKPARRIFEVALKRMAVPAQNSAHVGDMYGADVLGARDAGITQVWYNTRGLEPFDSHRPDHEIQRLTEILDIF